MTEDKQIKEFSDVPTQVFQGFLDDLKKVNISPAIVESLKNTLLNDKIFSEKALRAAIFPEDQSQ